HDQQPAKHPARQHSTNHRNGKAGSIARRGAADGGGYGLPDNDGGDGAPPGETNPFLDDMPVWEDAQAAPQMASRVEEPARAERGDSPAALAANAGTPGGDEDISKADGVVVSASTSEEARPAAPKPPPRRIYENPRAEWGAVQPDDDDEEEDQDSIASA